MINIALIAAAARRELEAEQSRQHNAHSLDDFLCAADRAAAGGAIHSGR
jgi:hypothetical protein